MIQRGTEASPVPEPLRLGATVLRVAWMSILLGLGMEALLVVAVIGAGAFGGAAPFLVDLVQKVSWSLFVCVGVTIGMSVPVTARPAGMGVAGALAAPLAFQVAGTLQRVLGKALDLAGSASSVSLLLLATIKGVEYAFLGALVGWLQTRTWSGLMDHMVLGFATGIVFGSALVGLAIAATGHGLPLVELLSRCFGEFLGPIGCALVLYAGRVFEDRTGA